MSAGNEATCASSYAGRRRPGLGQVFGERYLTASRTAEWDATQLNRQSVSVEPDERLRICMPLFRVDKHENAEHGLLGYDWLEVLAIEPWALAFPTKEYGDWCDRRISNYYVCL